jgi:hypothetical protein
VSAVDSVRPPSALAVVNRRAVIVRRLRRCPRRTLRRMGYRCKQHCAIPLVPSSCHEDDEQSALIVYFQTGERTIAKDVRLELLCQVGSTVSEHSMLCSAR